MDETAIERELGLHEDDPTTNVDDQFNEDVELLRTAFVNEKMAPEILNYEMDLVLNIKAQLENQQKIVDDVGEDADAVFTTSIYQMEIDRIKFMLVSYLRTRLAKIENYTLHILKSPEIYNRLSPQELEFAQQYLNFTAEHFKNCALSQLPQAFRKITDQSEEVDMIRAPPLDKFVFCTVKRDIGEVQMDERQVHRPWLVLNQHTDDDRFQQE